MCDNCGCNKNTLHSTNENVIARGQTNVRGANRIYSTPLAQGGSARTAKTSPSRVGRRAQAR